MHPYRSSRPKIFCINVNQKNSRKPEADLRGRRGREGALGVRALPIFCNLLFFCNHFEELQTVLFEVELIINNAPLTYVYPNTIEKCLTPNDLLFGRQ